MADDSEEGAKEQVRQLERVLKDGVRTVILTSIDYDAINESKVLDKYPDINLISYDRMLMNNPHVDIFVGCNPSDIDKMQAHYILERFKSMGGSPKKLEVIAVPSVICKAPAGPSDCCCARRPFLSCVRIPGR